MLARLVVVVVVLVAVACGPNHAQRCATSQQARVDGWYDAPTPADAAAANSAFTYNCLSACVDGSEPACVEAHLLAADAHPGSTEHLDRVVADCKAGTPGRSCAWVDQHQAEIATANADRDRAAAVAAAIAAMPEAEAPVGRAVAAFTAAAAAQGQRLVTDHKHSLQGSRLVIELSALQQGRTYTLTLVGNRTTMFKAHLSDVDQNNAVDIDGGFVGAVYSRGGAFIGNGNTQFVTIINLDGDRGVVRLLLFEQD